MADPILDQMFEDNKPSLQDEFNIVIVLDRSGSMSSVRTDAMGGVNTYIEEQKKDGGNAYLSMIQFDDVYGDPSYWRKPIAEVELLDEKNYIPRGMTALLDAIGKTIAKVNELRTKGEIAGKVQFVIQTDGMENSSKEYTKRTDVAELLTKAREEGWADFIFLGTNIDAFAEGASMGFARNRTVQYDNSKGGLESTYYFACVNTKAFRRGAVIDDKDLEEIARSASRGEDVTELYNKVDKDITANDKE